MAFKLHINIFEVVLVEFTKEQLGVSQILKSQTKCSNLCKQKRSESEKQARLSKRNAFDRKKRSNETQAERMTRLNKRNAFEKQIRLNETESKRQARLSKTKCSCKKNNVKENRVNEKSKTVKHK